MCHTPASYSRRNENTYVQLNVFIHVRLHGLHEYTSVDTGDRPFLTDTLNTYPGVDLPRDNSIEVCEI
mgnify:FL=1